MACFSYVRSSGRIFQLHYAAWHNSIKHYPKLQNRLSIKKEKVSVEKEYESIFKQEVAVWSDNYLNGYRNKDSVKQFVLAGDVWEIKRQYINKRHVMGFQIINLFS